MYAARLGHIFTSATFTITSTSRLNLSCTSPRAKQSVVPSKACAPLQAFLKAQGLGALLQASCLPWQESPAQGNYPLLVCDTTSLNFIHGKAAVLPYLACAIVSWHVAHGWHAAF